jgi:hypothetical protein
MSEQLKDAWKVYIYTKAYYPLMKEHIQYHVPLETIKDILMKIHSDAKTVEYNFKYQFNKDVIEYFKKNWILLE